MSVESTTITAHEKRFLLRDLHPENVLTNRSPRMDMEKKKKHSGREVFYA